MARKESAFYAISKRFFDICVGSVGSVFALLVLLGVKIIYLVDKDNDRIILVQDRIGEGGQLFKLYKIRTMVPKAQEMLSTFLSENPHYAAEYEKNKKLENDPRITNMGKKLRKFSIDEFPQFFNVVKGDMSIIGNRPYLPSERDDMGEDCDIITNAKPGIISYWAINGRNDVDFETRLELEKYYSLHKSLLLDLRIGFSAVSVVLKAKGAK
ncbi:MAG: sugar transferase [Actinomycetaceae bacterium]|nr:sugar transferase [Actinomycetaceae bacterium]